VQFHRGSSPGAFWLPLATTFKLLAQAAPVIVLLFLLFPRVNTAFQFRIGDLHAARTGFSDRLSPGGIAALSNSTDIAFRAEFPDRRTGPIGPMYWRRAGLWGFGGTGKGGPFGPAPPSPPSPQY